MNRVRQIFWSGLHYHSSEKCTIVTGDAGYEISGLILGCSDGVIYETRYRIEADTGWSTRYVTLESEQDGRLFSLSCNCAAPGNWQINGRPEAAFAGAADVDISLTPFTNTLPVNRLRLQEGASEAIRLLYIDVLEQAVRPVQQRYTRLTGTSYRYEHIPKDFEAVLEVDACGLVIHYPGLFERR